MKKYSINETFTSKQNQQIFCIEKPFVNDSISVFVNGILQILGESKDYLTVQNTGRVVFNKPLSEGDTVSVISNIESNRIDLEILSQGKADKPNALYKKYGTVERLKPNNKYEVCISLNKEIYKWNFVSHLTPMFTSSKKIYEDIGEFLEGFTEEYINSMIYRNSNEVIELINELAEQGIENVHYEIDSDGNYIGDNRAIKNWVKFKTEIDLILARYFGISYKYGTVKKTVGDITIEKSTKLPYIDNLLDRLKKQFKEADDVIKGVNSVVSTVKAIVNYKYDNWARETNF